MNWLKAMLLMVVLGAILYGVNLVLNKSAPVESPGSNGGWPGNEGSLGPPAISPGVAGTTGQPPYNSGPYRQPPTGYASKDGYSTSAPPANSSVYGAGPSHVVVGSGVPTGNSAGAASPAGTSPFQSVGYQKSAPPIANSESSHAGTPATPAGFATENPNSTPSAAPASNPGGGAEFAAAMDDAKALLREGKLTEGLKRLTVLYDHLYYAPQLNPEESKQLDDLLGRLAGTVVYSRQHLLMPAYEVKPGDRLEKIAEEYQVPAGLLAKINGITDPEHLPAGRQLKVLHGPFMAFVSLNRREVTLVVQQCYAGRFKLIGLGKNAATLNGDFKIDRKVLNLGPEKRPDWPSVNHWIGFDNQFGFCAMSDTNATDISTGLTLSSRDAEDLFDILSVGSSVVVR